MNIRIETKNTKKEFKPRSQVPQELVMKRFEEFSTNDLFL